MSRLLFAVVLSAIMFSGCRKSNYEDLELEDWSPVLAIPLVSTEIKIDDVLTELNHPEEILILDDGIVALNYKGELFSFSPENIVVIESQSVSETVQLGATEAQTLDMSPTPIDLPGIAIPVELELAPAEVKIDEIAIESGSLSMSLTRLQDENVSGQLQINELLDQNDQIVTIDINGGEPVNTPEEISIDLAGYKLQPTLIPPFTNQITFTVSLTLSDNSSNTAIAGDFISVDLTLSNLQFEHVIGDFGNLDLTGDNDTINLNLFQNIQNGEFGLTEAIINLDITNSFGFPFDIELGNVVSVNQNSGVETQLFLADVSLEGQLTIGGEPEMKTFSFDNDNSDVTPLFDPAPVDIIFDITAESNPSGPPLPSQPNFITNTSSFDIDVDVVLPLNGYVLNVLISDTTDINISFEEFAQIDSLEFRLNTDNGFPLDIELQAFFIDSTSTVIDSLFLNDERIISSAMVNLDGEVVTPSSEVTFITFTSEKAERLESAKRVRFNAIINSNQSTLQQAVKIKENQGLDLELGVKIYGTAEL